MVVLQFSQNVLVVMAVLEFSLSGYAGCDGGVTVVSGCAGCDCGFRVLPLSRDVLVVMVVF